MLDRPSGNAMAPEREAAEVGGHESASERTVYVVDDESEVRRSLGFFLKTAGYLPRPYLNGRDFLADAGELAPGCVLLDLRMPELDGLLVLERLGGRSRRL